ncbi:adenylosuccinate synthetase [Synechococcus sp. CS-1326]|nr:adenylosuccinate synthetase [Synechococcus sp. CS-1326]
MVGGQFGSEGKGKVAHWLAKSMNASVAIRVGGPNSGHTVIDDHGNPVVFQQLPTACLLGNIDCILPAGSYIRVSHLFDEIAKSEISTDRIHIDPNAIVITDQQVFAEQAGGLGNSIGSTQSGTGIAVIDRLQRNGKSSFAANTPELQHLIRPVMPFIRNKLDSHERIIIEGTQGFGLSPLHSPHYPYVTSRDTTASGFVSEAGLSPLDVDDVVMVIRTFPIRVAGNSGPLAYELTWSDVFSRNQRLSVEPEKTSVTNRVRRVAAFDSSIVCQAIQCNQPTRIVLNHIDYVDEESKNAASITPNARNFILQVEKHIGREIDFLGCGRDSICSRNALTGSSAL